MDKQRIDAIRVELSTIANDIEDFIDKNEIVENSTTSEIDCNISKIEEFRTSYRKLHNKLKIFFWSKLRGVMWKRQREAVVVNEILIKKENI